MALKNLRDWQKSAKIVFKQHNYRGIVKAATGTGKTIFAIDFIDDFKADIMFSSEESFLITVHTENLLNQWSSKIESITGFPVGKIGAGHNHEEKITVAIINSVRERKMNYNNLIMDECHHYLSDINSGLLELNKFQRILGLSATPERSDLRDFSKYGLEIIFEYTVDEAIENKDLCDYEIIKVGVELNGKERELYDRQEELFKKYFPEFRTSMKDIYNPPWSLEKMHLRNAIRKRVAITSRSQEKIKEIVNLIKKNPTKKVMVFAQYIYTMQAIFHALYADGITSVKYNEKKERQMALDAYKNDRTNVLISARALDEGLDIPATDMIIILSGFKGERQSKQRVGRGLRKKEQKAMVYLLFCYNTVDEKWLKDVLKYI